MILGIICFLLSILGIYGFFSEFYILTYIAFIFCLFENVSGRLNGSSKTIMPFLIACFIGVLFTKNLWLGMSIGACFENAVMFIGGLFLMLYFYFISKKAKTINKNVSIDIQRNLDSLEENAPKNNREL